MRRFTSLALGVAAAAMIAGAGIAAAQTSPPAGPPAGASDRPHSRGDHFVQFLDIDKDGKVSLKEIDDEIGRLFGAADLKGDGKLTPEEFQRRGQMFMQLRVMTLFDLLDANGDGVLTKQEMEAPAARWFKRYDKNGDGFISAEELPQGGPRGRGPMGPRPGMVGPAGPMGPNR
jgi:hypothetical protein